MWRWGVDNRERLALAEKVQKSIKERTINYPLLQRREELEEEFKKLKAPS
jgi:ABC-type thiamine transport system substrate-binding protein